jgi:hypothetical protein
MPAKNGQNQRLCYLDASRVKGPNGDLAGVTLETSTAEEIGKLDGLLIDPATRRVCFFVVEKPGWLRSRKYLVPTDCLAQVADGRDALRVEVNPEDLHTFESVRGTVRQFSDEDFVDALFAKDAA